MTGNARADALHSEPENGASPEKARAGESPPSGRLKGFVRIGFCRVPPVTAAACEYARFREGAFCAPRWVVPRSLAFVPRKFSALGRGFIFCHTYTSKGRKDTMKNVTSAELRAMFLRFYKEKGHYRLQPENSTMEPIIVDDCRILGKVIAVVRHLS